MNKNRTYDWNGHRDIPISMSDFSDEQMASTVRMLGRNDLDHEGVVCAARDRIMALVKEKAELTKSLDGWKFEAERFKEDRDRIWNELKALFAADKRNVWYYQGDGFDFPESLACPVVMHAEQFRELMAAQQKLKELESQTAG